MANTNEGISALLAKFTPASTKSNVDCSRQLKLCGEGGIIWNIIQKMTKSTYRLPLILIIYAYVSDRDPKARSYF